MEQNHFKKTQKNNVTLKDQFICHLVYEHDFIQQFNDMIVESFDVREHLFIVYAMHAWDESKKYHLKNSYYIDRFDDQCFLEWVEKSVQIIVHCLYTPAVTDFLFTHQYLLNKVNWKLWGGDLYLYRQVGSISNSESNEARRKSIIKQIAYITSPVEEEVKHAIDVYNSKAQYKFAFYPQAKDFREFRLNDDSPKKQTINILVGNSGYPTNNHFQAFNYLSKFQNEPIKIYCPLSYGDKPYTEEVCAKGKQIFGDKFVPLLNFFPFDEYASLLNTMDVVVMNHDRQQGMGNILTSLYLGKKVYMQPDITSYKCLSRCGVTLFDINEIEKNDFNHFIAFSDHRQKINSEIIESLYSKGNCVKSWQAIFNEAITREKEPTRRFYLINFHYKDFYSNTIRNPSLGPAYILQHLSDNGVLAKVHELSFNDDTDYLLKDIKMFSPDLIGCSFMTYHYRKTYKYIEALKCLGIPIVCGGAHVNSKGPKVMDELDVDFLIKGEGEKSLLSLLQNIKDPEAFPNIPGLIYRKNGTVVENDAEIIDIEELRFPRYRNFDLNQYADGRILIQTSRGCPYQCTFCQQASLLGKKWRARSPQNIIHELEYWGALGKTSLVFGDDNLTLDKKRIHQLCELMKKSKYRFQIETAGVRIDNVDYDTLKMMRDVGFNYLSYGVESGSDRVLKEIRKGITLNQIHKTLEMSCKLGFNIKLYFIINNRTETYKEAQQSFSLSRQYPINLARFTNLCPFPGTYDYEWILKHGKLLYPPEEYLNNPNDFIDKPIYDGPGMSMEERMQVIEDAKAELARPKNPITPLFLNSAENKGSMAISGVWINKNDIRKTPQRVLFVNHNVYPLEKSGTPLSTQNHALGMVKKGLDVAVLIPRAVIKHGYLKEKTADGFTLYQVPAMDKFAAYLTVPYQAGLSDYRQDIERIVEDFHPQIVQINDYVLMPAEIVEIFSRKGCIVIREVCNCEEFCHQDYPVISDGLRGLLCSGPESPHKCASCFADLPKTGSRRAKKGTSPRSVEEEIEQRFNYIKKLYKDVVDKVIFTSEPFKAFYTRFIQIPEEKMKVIPRGFSFSYAKHMRRVKNTDAPMHFAFIGNIMFSKGIDVSLKAFEKICQGYHFVFHIYGEMVNSEYHDWIERLQVQYPGRFVYHGGYQVDELPKILSNIDACIVPSYFDTYNRVVREMLYLGIPVIVTDFFGAYIVDDGKNGFKIPIGDAEALAGKMIDIIRHPDVIEDLAKGAAQTPIPSLEEEINMLIETYNELYNQVPEAKKALLDVTIRPDKRQKSSPEKSVGLIAFYLPQYHPIPENDQWWGKGFTEWTNVSKAKPLFPGHYQPHLPADLGFYDLRLPEIRKAQADLAREYGIQGFCYYHYWFNGKLLLERPLQEMLKSGEPDFPFCMCWANENWTRAWDGGSDQILIQQNYNEKDDLEHIRYLCHIFQDRRYIRINGKPLFLVYRANSLPDPLKTTSLWREEARRLGLGELFLCRVESFPDEHTDPTTIGFDASVEFQPDWTELGPRLLDDQYGGHCVYKYENVVEGMLKKEQPEYRRFPCVTPSWDNTSRRKNGATIFIDSTPQLYEKWLKETIGRLDSDNHDENIVFINAWNEWGEGNYLEPDLKFGRSYLEATKRALAAESEEDKKGLAEAYASIQQIFIQSGKYEEAIYALEKLLESYPDYALAHNDIAVLSSNKGNKEKARFHYEKAVSLNSGNPTFLRNLADFYYVEMKQIDEATRLYEKILTIRPQDVETLLILGNIHVELGKFDEAKAHYLKVLEIEPANELALKMQEALKERQQEARVDLRQAYEDAQSLIKSGNLDGAINQLEKLIQLNPDNALAHNDLGYLYYAKGKKEKALAHYEKAVELDPENITALKNLADFYYVEFGRTGDALKIYHGILEKNPNDVETLFAFGHICTSLNRIDDALLFYEKILKIDHGHEQARINLENLTKEGDLEKKEKARKSEASPAMSEGIICLRPFYAMTFAFNKVFNCTCPDWIKRSIGDIRSGTIAEIWNGIDARLIRRKMYNGEWQEICNSFCPHIIAYKQEGKIIRFADLEQQDCLTSQLIEEIRNRKDQLDSFPTVFKPDHSSICNLSCIMCSRSASTEDPALLKKITDDLLGYLPIAKRIILTGMGDPLARPDTRQLIINYRDGNLKFDLITNGLLLPKYWDQMRHQNFGHLLVSIDAADKEIYERIRVGGSWEDLLKSLDLIRRNREKFDSITLNMTVMRENYEKIPPFIDFAEFYGFNASFQRVRGQIRNQNIFEPREESAIEKLKGIIRNEQTKRRSIQVGFGDLLEFVPGDHGAIENEGVAISHSSERQIKSLHWNEKQPDRSRSIALVMCPVWSVDQPPLATAYIAGTLRARGYDIHCHDLSIELFRTISEEDRKVIGQTYLTPEWYEKFDYWKDRLSLDERAEAWARRILTEVPRVVGFSIYDSTLSISVLVAEKIKKINSETLVIFGGPSCQNEEILRNTQIDLMVSGEGEETITELLEIIERGGSWENCAGLAFRRDGKILKTPERELIKDINVIPYPDFDPFNLKSYPARMLPMFTSRGCPGRCTFCAERPQWKKYRYRSAENIVAEMERNVRRYSVSHFSIEDSLINGNISEFEKMCDLIIKKGMKVTWGGKARIHPKIDASFAQKLYRAGGRGLIFGIESASQKVLDHMGKGIQVADIEKVIKNCHKAGIQVSCFFITGYVNESEVDFQETIDFVKRNHLYMHHVFPGSGLSIMKNSLLHDHPQKYGIILPESSPDGRWRSADGTNTAAIREDRKKRFNTLISELYSKRPTQVIEKSTKTFPVTADHVIQGQIIPLIKQGHLEVAAVRLESLPCKTPDHGAAHNLLGILSYKKGDKEKARFHHEKAVSLNPNNPTFLKNLADFYYVELKQIDEASKLYEKVLSINPKDIETRLILANIHVELGKFDVARDCYLRVLEIEPANELALKMQEALKERQQEARVDLRQAYEEAQSLIKSGNLGGAIDQLEKLIQLNPDYALVHNDLGFLYFEKGEKEKALTHYERAVELDPKNITSLKNLADFYYVELGRTEDALKLYHGILEKNPDDVETLFAFGHICTSLNRIDDALCFYEKIVQINPDHTEAKAAVEEIFKKIRSGRAEGQKEAPESRVSMIIPVSDGPGSFPSSIGTLLQNTGYPNFEIVLISMGLPEAIGDFVTSLGNKNIKQFIPSENIKKIASLNLAARGATGDYLIFMDSRSLLSKNWLPSLLKVASATQNFGSVAPKVIDPPGSIIEAGFSLSAADGIKGAGEGEAIDCPKYNYFREVPSGSRFLMLISKEAFVESGGFDERITDLGLAMIDLGITLRRNGKAVFYQPSCILSLSKGQDGNGAGQGKICLDEKTIKSLRPSIVKHVAKATDVGPNSRKKVLVFGIYLANKLNNVADIVAELSTSKKFDVIQRWVALGGNPPNQNVADVTVKTMMGKKPKYEIMNELISAEDLTQYEYVFMTDDDVVLPEDFLDEFITLQEDLKFVIAQPARTPNSHIDHPIVEQQSGILARETLFVEIGPVVSFHRSVYSFIFPFDLTSSMGWGYENVWSYLVTERKMKMGIIDNTPVDHSIRKPVENYDWSKVDQERRDYLHRHNHLSLEACFTTLNVINYGGVR
ncbi:MAG: tetratricopeptide repeat protein [Deltaproteobacteria bacterium]|nr:tetratricopeptide repeat protein [Deltaproteobacteria bacterium]